MKIAEAQQAAKDASLDLVEIAAAAQPPVCRLMDFGKYRYQQGKKQQAAKRHQKQTQLKEVKFRPGTDEGDYQVKLRNLIRFLEKGNKVKVTLRYRGREMSHQEIGRKLLKRIEQDLQELAQVDQYPRMEGRQAVMLLGPKRKQ